MSWGLREEVRWDGGIEGRGENVGRSEEGLG